MSTTIKQHFYRNGQLGVEVPLKKGLRQGVVRTWHKNGALAREEAYKNDLPHGLCRQWDEKGRLLGKYRMIDGTGVERIWHDNGQIQMEISLVSGEFCGRNRIWLADGALLSERFCLHRKEVSAAEYRAAAAKDKSLPRFRGRPGKVLPGNSATEKRKLRVFVKWLLKKPNRCEARKWLTRSGTGKIGRALGRFKREADAAKFVQSLYDAGALKVVAPDIYANQAGDQFADCLVVRLPRDASGRKAIRKVCAQLRTRRLGAIQPDEDVGESYLYLSLS